MPRKKQTDLQSPPEESAATTVTSPSDNGAATAVLEPPKHEQNGEEKKKPLVSYRLNSDRTTSIELAVWSNTYKNQDGEEYEQLSMTIQRSYKTDDGWQRGGSWRAHDVPCLLFLLQKAHSFCLDRRTTDSTVPF